jgi:hypothetical protein
VKVKKYDAAVERDTLIGMITDREVLGTVAAKWEKDGLFANKWSNTVGGWCVAHYDRYGKPPRERIEHRFAAWADRTKDEATVDLVERFLDDLSDDYAKAKPGNAGYLKDQAAKYFRRVQLLKLRDRLDGLLDAGEVDDATALVENYNRVEMASSDGIDILRDQEAIRAAFEAKQEPLFQYNGGLKHFFADHLERDAFIAFMGPEKRGKSFWLMDVAWRAMLARRRVAMFEVGDMSQHQVIRRFMQRAARRPFKPGKVKVPRGIEHEPGETFATITEWAEREFTDRLSWQVAYKAAQKVLRTKVKSKDQMLRLSCHPNSTINVAGIRSILYSWIRRGWVPDVLVVDYADILAPPAGTVDTRDQINATWKQLRALSQELHILVATATQADAASYDAETLSKSNFSEDKRKLAHVTGMVGINQKDDKEKGDGLQRLNWVGLRDGEFSASRVCHVGGSLAVANPAVVSCW